MAVFCLRRTVNKVIILNFSSGLQLVQGTGRQEAVQDKGTGNVFWS